jgi:hypothetical protein
VRCKGDNQVSPEGDGCGLAGRTEPVSSTWSRAGQYDSMEPPQNGIGAPRHPAKRRR